MFRNFSILLLLLIAIHANAQKPKTAKDTAAFLASAFNRATTTLSASQHGKLIYKNVYTVSSFTIKGCRLEARVRMKNMPIGETPMNYALYYSIPLDQVYSIKPVPDDSSNGLLNVYKGAALKFRVESDHFYAIRYKMTEDRTKRVETDAGYNEAILFCDPKKLKQVLEMLNALKAGCHPKVQ